MIFNVFAHKILLVDAVWAWQGFIYGGSWRILFMGNKQGFDSKGSFFTFEEQNNNFFMANRAILTPTPRRDFTLPLHH